MGRLVLHPVKLAEARHRLCLRVRDIIGTTGLCKSTVIKALAGRPVSPRSSRLVCEALGLDPANLIVDERTLQPRKWGVE